MGRYLRKATLKVFRYSFSEATPIFFNRFKSDFILDWSLKKFTSNWLYIDICQTVGFSKIRFYVNKHKNLETDKRLILRDLDQPTENPTLGT